jgi:hypothetical protein
MNEKVFVEVSSWSDRGLYKTATWLCTVASVLRMMRHAAARKIARYFGDISIYPAEQPNTSAKYKNQTEVFERTISYLRNIQTSHHLRVTQLRPDRPILHESLPILMRDQSSTSQENCFLRLLRNMLHLFTIHGNPEVSGREGIGIDFGEVTGADAPFKQDVNLSGTESFRFRNSEI